MDERYIAHIKQAHEKLGISKSFLAKNILLIQVEPMVRRTVPLAQYVFQKIQLGT